MASNFQFEMSLSPFAYCCCWSANLYRKVSMLRVKIELTQKKALIRLFDLIFPMTNFGKLRHPRGVEQVIQPQVASIN